MSKTCFVYLRSHLPFWPLGGVSGNEGVDCSASLIAFGMETWFSACGLACWAGTVLQKESVQLKSCSIAWDCHKGLATWVSVLFGYWTCFSFVSVGMFNARHASRLGCLNILSLTMSDLVLFCFKEANVTTVNIHCTECAYNSLRYV